MNGFDGRTEHRLARGRLEETELFPPHKSPKSIKLVSRGEIRDKLIRKCQEIHAHGRSSLAIGRTMSRVQNG